MMASPIIPRTVVKFRDNVRLPYQDHVESFFEKPLADLWTALLKQFPGLTITRFFTSLAPDEIEALVNRAMANDQHYHPPNFLNYFAVDCPDGVDPEAVAAALSTWPPVEFAYSEGLEDPDPTVNPADDPLSCKQKYLDAADMGIDARYAWSKVPPSLAGFGDGAGKDIGFMDMERGWKLDHADLVSAGITQLPGIPVAAAFDHGTSVLGIVVAVDNDKYCVGIATHATARVISVVRPTGIHDRADAIMCAVSMMAAGDVLLLENQYVPSWGFPLPIEVLPGVFDAISLGTAAGVVIIEPAANGIQDLATFTNMFGHHVLDRSSVEFKDSGAIMVAAATSSVPHQQIISGTNFGNRIDCYAWGDSVFTLADDVDANDNPIYYTDHFGGTSGASAIVAGAALVVQSVAVARSLPRRTPAQLRTILANSANGTASAPAPFNHIGVMPDLRKILYNVFGIT